MTTNYHRQFRPIAWMLLAAIVILGIAFHIFIFDFLVTNNEQQLERNARAVAMVTSSYLSSKSNPLLDSDFWVTLDFGSSLSGAQMLLCDTDGTVLLCFEGQQSYGCEHVGKHLDAELTRKAIRTGKVSSTSLATNVYDETYLTVAVPIIWNKDKVFGVIAASIEMSSITETTAKSTKMYIFTSTFVLIITLLCMMLLTKKQNKPLKELANAARSLGHGNLDVRVRTGNPNSREFDEVAVAFNNMANSLQTVEKQRQEFVANVSHELKTPMTTIAGYMDGMLDGTIPPERHEYYMQIISNEVRRLSRLVRSMLDISRMRSQGLDQSKMRRFDLCDAVGQTLLSFEKRIVDKRLDVQVDMPDVPTFTYAEQDSITQVIYNLIDNAVKFCKEEGILGISVTPNGNKLQVQISNTGATISPEELPRVFDRFHKTDKSRSANPDGAGLGLYIVKTIICGHGEDISVTSRDEKTTFTFTLPLIKQRAKEEYNG